MFIIMLRNSQWLYAQFCFVIMCLNSDFMSGSMLYGQNLTFFSVGIGGSDFEKIG